MVAPLVKQKAVLVAFITLSAFSVVPAAAQYPQAAPSHCPAPYIPPITMVGLTQTPAEQVAGTLHCLPMAGLQGWPTSALATQVRAAVTREEGEKQVASGPQVTGAPSLLKVSQGWPRATGGGSGSQVPVVRLQ